MPFNNDLRMPLHINDDQAERISAALRKVGFQYDAVQVKCLFNNGLLETEPDRDFGRLPGHRERVVQAVESALLQVVRPVVPRHRVG
jgi:hypothetical protein